MAATHFRQVVQELASTFGGLTRNNLRRQRLDTSLTTCAVSLLSHSVFSTEKTLEFSLTVYNNDAPSMTVT